MKIIREQRYHQPMSKVFDAFSDPALLEDKLRFLGSRNIDIRKMTRDANGLQVDVVREVPAEAPSMLKKFVADWNTIRQQDNWTIGGKEIKGTFQVELEGIPVKVDGIVTLTDEGSSTLHTVELRADSRIPLVGKKLAEFIGSKSDESLKNEFDFWLDHLKG